MSYSTDDATQSKRGLRVGVFALLLPVLLIVVLVYSVVSNTPPSGATNGANMPSAVEARIAKVGAVTLKDSGAGKALRTGEEIVTKGPCAACHATGALGAPKIGDKAAWAPRIATGNAALLQSAMKGKNSMPAQGGGDLQDIEVARAVVYLANAGGAKFAEPAAPAAAAPASAASAAK